MEQGYFYTFYDRNTLIKFCKENNIKKQSNMFFCTIIKNKTYIFNVINSKYIEFDKDFYIEQKINNVLYYIDITKIYEINKIENIKKISSIKHGTLLKKCNNSYDNIKDKYEYLINEKHNKKQYIGNIITSKTNRKIFNLYNNLEHLSVDLEEYLIIGEKNEWYYGCYIFKKKEENSIPIHINKKIYGYINLNYTFKLKKFYFSNISDFKLNVYEIYNKVINLKKQYPKKNIQTNNEQKNNINISKIKVIVKNNINSCKIKEHELNECIGKIAIITNEGNIVNREIPIFYCKKCQKYYLSILDYNKLRKIGLLLCEIIFEERYQKNKNNLYYEMNLESVLHSYGYNVNKTENLSDAQRRTLLSTLIDNQLMKKEEIANHLSYLIRRSSNNKNFNDAIDKWEDDRNFVLNYKINKKEIYDIELMKVRKYKNVKF